MSVVMAPSPCVFPSPATSVSHASTFICFLAKLPTPVKTTTPTKHANMKSAETTAPLSSATLVYTRVMHINKANKQ